MPRQDDMRQNVNKTKWDVVNDKRGSLQKVRPPELLQQTEMPHCAKINSIHYPYILQLMCSMLPLTLDPSKARLYFRILRRRWRQTQVPRRMKDVRWVHLQCRLQRISMPWVSSPQLHLLHHPQQDQSRHQRRPILCQNLLHHLHPRCQISLPRGLQWGLKVSIR